MESNNKQEPKEEEKLNEPLHQNQTQNQGQPSSSEVKTCKGCLYYSSQLKSSGSNPRCIGFPRTLPQVRGHIVEDEASEKARTFYDFRYACAGYSRYPSKDYANDEHISESSLPSCYGFKFLSFKNASAPAQVHNEEGAPELPQTRQLPRKRSPKPSRPTGDEFLTRFTRNASVVASGVARNTRRVGNYIKKNFAEIMNRYRGKPK